MSLSEQFHQAATPLDSNRAELGARVHRVAVQANTLAREMLLVNHWLWALEESQLLDLLSDNPALTASLLDANEALGGAVNTHLNLYDHVDLRNRVPEERGRTDIEFDPATGRFVVIAPAPLPTS